MRLPKRTEIETAINHRSHPADYIMFAMSNIDLLELTGRVLFCTMSQIDRGR